MNLGKHKSVKTRILEDAETIGWVFVWREEAEHRRGFVSEVSR